jgi:uncharacterized protein DUF4410
MIRLNAVMAVMLGSMALFPNPAGSQAAGMENEGGHTVSRPRVIYVADFAIDTSLVQTSSDVPSQVIGRDGGLIARLREHAGSARQADSTNPEIEASQAVDQLAKSIVSTFVNVGMPAERIAAGTTIPADCWLMRGEFDKLSEGNRLQQSVIGFGAGQPEVEVSGAIVATQAGTATTILGFGDESQQHRMPGGIVTRNPYVIAAKFVMSRHATGRDVQQLGASLASEIVSYMRANGLVN